jgi:hypothetical protein
MPPNAVFLATFGEEGDAGTEALVKTSTSSPSNARPELSTNAFAIAAARRGSEAVAVTESTLVSWLLSTPTLDRIWFGVTPPPTSSAAAFATESCEMSSALFAAACHDGTPFVPVDGTKSLAVAEYSLAWSSDQTSADPAARSAHSAMSHARRPSDRRAPRSSAVLRTSSKKSAPAGKRAAKRHLSTLPRTCSGAELVRTASRTLSIGSLRLLDAKLPGIRGCGPSLAARDRAR